MIHFAPCHRFTQPIYLYPGLCFYFKGIWGFFVIDDFGNAVESGNQLDEECKFEGEH